MEALDLYDPVTNYFDSQFNEREITGSTALSIKMKYEGHLESKERFAIKKYLLIIGKKQNTRMLVLSHTFSYFST